MSRRFTQAFVALLAAFLAAQFIRPDIVNPKTDPNRTIGAQAGAANGVAAIVNRACRDCHSNETVWPSYARVAPLSWLMAYGVSKGRKAVNFSDWSGYSPDVQQMLLAASCDDVSSGKMPGIYTALRPETRLSRQDVETICAAARQADATTVAGGAK